MQKILRSARRFAKINNLFFLLENLQPTENPGTYVFVSIPGSEKAVLEKIDGAGKIMQFMENEGVTFVLKEEIAKSLELSFDGTFKWITIQVHSSLSAIGLTAALSQKLTNEKISCNVIAGFYHDHIFVPTKDFDRAMAALKSISQKI